MKKYAILIIVAFLLSTLSCTVQASPEKCREIDNSPEKDRCYLKNAVNVSDCFLINETSIKKDCLHSLIQEFDREEQCEELPTAYKEACRIIVVYNKNPKNITSCHTLKDHINQKDCIDYYIQKNRIKDLNHCLRVKGEYQRECAYKAALNRYGFNPFTGNNRSEQECQKYQGNIREGCKDYFKRMKASGDMIAVFLTPIISAIIGLIGFLATIFFVIFAFFGLIASLIITVIVAITIIILWKKKKKEDKHLEKH